MSDLVLNQTLIPAKRGQSVATHTGKIHESELAARLANGLSELEELEGMVERMRQAIDEAKRALHKHWSPDSEMSE
jgi:hypothetical protein